jgi:hypothetical protein
MAETIEETYESAVTRKVVRTNLKIEEVRIAHDSLCNAARAPQIPAPAHAPTPPAHITDNTFDSDTRVNIVLNRCTEHTARGSRNWTLYRISSVVFLFCLSAVDRGCRMSKKYSGNMMNRLVRLFSSGTEGPYVSVEEVRAQCAT